MDPNGTKCLSISQQSLADLYSADCSIRWVVKDFGAVKLLNNPTPKSKKGLLRFALDLWENSFFNQNLDWILMD